MCLVKPSVTLLWGKYNNPIETLITLWQRFGERVKIQVMGRQPANSVERHFYNIQNTNINKEWFPKIHASIVIISSCVS